MHCTSTRGMLWRGHRGFFPFQPQESGKHSEQPGALGTQGQVSRGARYRWLRVCNTSQWLGRWGWGPGRTNTPFRRAEGAESPPTRAAKCAGRVRPAGCGRTGQVPRQAWLGRSGSGEPFPGHRDRKREKEKGKRRKEGWKEGKREGREEGRKGGERK